MCAAGPLPTMQSLVLCVSSPFMTAEEENAEARDGGLLIKDLISSRERFRQLIGNEDVSKPEKSHWSLFK